MLRFFMGFTDGVNRKDQTMNLHFTVRQIRNQTESYIGDIMKFLFPKRVTKFYKLHQDKGLSFSGGMAGTNCASPTQYVGGCAHT